MKKISKVFAVVVAAASLFVMAGCSQSDGGGNSKTYIGTKTPSEAKAVGDIVFNDGSATPYSVIEAREENDTETESKITKKEKDNAIAVIFYVGTGLNSEVDNQPDTTTVRTLGVGLKLKKEVKWCLDTANGYNTSNYPGRCGFENTDGVERITGDINGRDNYVQLAEFLGENDDTSSGENYPACYYAINYNDDMGNLGQTYSNDWFIPSLAELNEFSREFNSLKSSLEFFGIPTLSLGWVWTSSFHSSATCAFVMRIDTQRSGIYSKNVENTVWPIREF